MTTSDKSHTSELERLFNDHYWDSFQKDKDLIMKHVRHVLSLSDLPQIEKLQAENAEWEATFELFDNAQARAIAEWRKQDPEGRRLKLPDMKDLTLWLITTLSEERQQLDQLRAACAVKDEALNMAYELQVNCLVDFEKYGLKKDADIAVKLKDAISHSSGSSLLAELEAARKVVEETRKKHFYSSYCTHPYSFNLIDTCEMCEKIANYDALSASEGKKEEGNG